ncbi:MAG TPA: hypothetical protein VFZ65_04440 [Planctomycetota bacterium]|nr:hypothetical protein [Planctomycetota bacterium]
MADTPLEAPVEPGPPPRSRWHLALILLAALVPALPWLVDLPHFGALQYNDYYGIVAQVLDDGHFSADPMRWLLLKSNEHTVTIPALLYAANFALTNGDNRTLSLLAIVFAILCALLAGSMIRRGCGAGPWLQAGATFVASALWFTPAAAHSYVLGFSGTIWITANLLTVWAMWRLVRVRRDDRARAVLPVIVIGALGALTYTTNLSLWPALLLGAVLLGLDRRKIALLAFGTALVFLMQWLLRHHPEGHPALNSSLGPVVEFTGAYLAWPFTGEVAVARFAGLFGMAVVFVALVWLLLVRDRGQTRAAAPFLMLAIYGLGNAIGTAVGRSAWGIHAAPASRYVSLAMSFWLGVLGLGAWLALRVLARRREGGDALRPVRIGVVLAAATLMLSTWIFGQQERLDYAERAAWNPLAALALRDRVLTDTEVLAKVNSDPGQFLAVPWLETLGHIPFDGPTTLLRGARPDPELLQPAPDPRVAGHLDALQPVGEGVVRVKAWAAARVGELAEALVLDETGAVRGELVFGSPREDVAEQWQAGWRWSGLRGYAFAGTEPARLRIYTRLVGERTWSPLVGELVLAAGSPR